MARDSKCLMESYHIHMAQVLEQCAKQLIQIIKDDLKYLKMKTIKCRNYRTKMIKFENLLRLNPITHDLRWSYIPDHPYRTLIVRNSGPGRTTVLLNLISNHPDIDKIYLYTKDVGDIYRIIDDYNPGNRQKILIVFDDTITDMISNKDFIQ